MFSLSQDKTSVAHHQDGTAIYRWCHPQEVIVPQLCLSIRTQPGWKSEDQFESIFRPLHTQFGMLKLGSAFADEAEHSCKFKNELSHEVNNECPYKEAPGGNRSMVLCEGGTRADAWEFTQSWEVNRSSPSGEAGMSWLER